MTLEMILVTIYNVKGASVCCANVPPKFQSVVGVRFILRLQLILLQLKLLLLLLLYCYYCL